MTMIRDIFRTHTHLLTCSLTHAHVNNDYIREIKWQRNLGVEQCMLCLGYIYFIARILDREHGMLRALSELANLHNPDIRGMVSD